MSPGALVGDRDADALEREGIIAAWTAEAPEPAYWLETAGFARLRNEIAAALRAGAGPIVLTGASGHGKSLLLRSLWLQPPRGFAPILVPFADVEPGEIAAAILSTTRAAPVHDAETALKRLLVTHDRRRSRPLLLVDELQSMSPAALAHWFALASAAQVEVELVGAGLDGAPLRALARELPREPRWLAVDAAWTRADAERLVVRIAASLQVDVVALLAEIDLDSAVGDSNGNPRLVRGAIAAQLRQLDLARLHVARVKESPIAVPPAPTQSAPPEPIAPAEREPEPEPEPVAAPVVSQLVVAPSVRLPVPPARPLPPPRSAAPAPPRTRSRLRRRRFSAARVGALVVAAAATAFVADPFERPRAWAQREIASARAAWDARKSEPVVVAAADPPIRVRVNSDPWSNVEIDGVAAGATPLSIDLAPGPHSFRAELSDGRVIERLVHVSPELDRIAFQ